MSVNVVHLENCQRFQSVTPTCKTDKHQSFSVNCTNLNSPKGLKLPPLPSKKDCKRNTGLCLRKLSKIIDSNHILFKKSKDRKLLKILKKNQQKFELKKNSCVRRWSESLSRRFKILHNKKTSSSLVCVARSKIANLESKCANSRNLNFGDQRECDITIDSSQNDSEKDKKNCNSKILILKRKNLTTPDINLVQEMKLNILNNRPSQKVSENDLLKSLRKVKIFKNEKLIKRN